MISLDNKLFWHDATGCHWCGRNTDSIKDGHDGMCPIPLLVIYDEQVAQLEAKNERLQGRIEHAESFDSEMPNSAYFDKELINGVGRTWESLNDSQKQYWIDRATQPSEVSDETE